MNCASGLADAAAPRMMEMLWRATEQKDCVPRADAETVVKHSVLVYCVGHGVLRSINVSAASHIISHTSFLR